MVETRTRPDPSPRAKHKPIEMRDHEESEQEQAREESREPLSGACDAIREQAARGEASSAPDAASETDPAAGAYERFYDFLVDHTDELAHLKRLVAELAPPPATARILECGTGTGRLAVPLALAGHEILGLDRSPRMLARAEARWQAACRHHGLDAQAAQRYHLVEADFTQPPAKLVAPESFDLVLFSSNTLALVPEERRQHAALRHAYQALRPGGVLLLEQLHPAGFFDEAFRQREWYHQFTRRNRCTGLLTSRSVSFLHDPVEQQVWGTTLLEEFLPSSHGGGSRRYMFVEQVRYHHVAELRLRLSVLGFKRRSIELYGGHEKEPLTPRSLKLVALARK